VRQGGREEEEEGRRVNQLSMGRGSHMAEKLGCMSLLVFGCVLWADVGDAAKVPSVQP
jgi:hypothetical protein